MHAPVADAGIDASPVCIIKKIKIKKKVKKQKNKKNSFFNCFLYRILVILLISRYITGFSLYYSFLVILLISALYILCCLNGLVGCLYSMFVTFSSNIVGVCMSVCRPLSVSPLFDYMYV